MIVQKPNQREGEQEKRITRTACANNTSMCASRDSNV